MKFLYLITQSHKDEFTFYLLVISATKHGKFLVKSRSQRKKKSVCICKSLVNLLID